MHPPRFTPHFAPRLTPWSRHALLALVGALLLTFAAGPASAAPPVTLTGDLTIVHVDPVPLPGGRPSPLRPHIRPFLTDDRGQETELAIEAAALDRAGGLLALDGRRVTVTLDPGPAAAGTGPRRARDIRPADGPSIAALDPAAPKIKGSQPFASLLCRFGDSTDVSPFDRFYIRDLLGSARPGLDHYFREVSYGAIDLVNSIAFDWKNLPSPRASYIGPNGAGLTKLRDDCLAAHAEVNFTQFKGINLFFNQELNGSAAGARELLTLDGQTRRWAVTWVGMEAGVGPEGSRQFVVAHEMGHGFGLPHSSGQYGETYDSGWDVMSDGRDDFEDIVESRQDFPFGGVATHTTSAHKDFLGWIPAARKFTLAAGDRAIVRLARIAQPATGDFLMAQVPIKGSSTKFYTVELRQNLERDGGRQKVSYDDGVPAGFGGAVVIHEVDYARNDRNARVEDADNNGDPNDNGAMWLAGETFTDAANGVMIRVGSIDREAGTAVVTVENQPAITIDDVTVSEPAAPAGTAQARFTVRLSYASSEGVGLDYVTAAGTATEGADYIRAAGHLSIPAGTTSATITVSVKRDTLVEVNETFFVNLKNPIGASLGDSRARGTIRDRAASPPPPPTPIPCPPPHENCQEP
jgi:M6 family metalloprotease-like protein